MEADWSAIAQLKEQAVPTADSGDYATANKILGDLHSQFQAYQTKREKLEQQKQTYDEALAALQPQLIEASQTTHLKLEAMQLEMIAVQEQMEAAAQAEGYEEAMTQLTDLAGKVDAYATALQELEAQKQAYDEALAALQPIMRSSAGRTKARKVTITATGLPGRPNSTAFLLLF